MVRVAFQINLKRWVFRIFLNFFYNRDMNSPDWFPPNWGLVSDPCHCQSQQVQWTQFRIATLTLHLGPIPDADHYQGFLLTNGDVWMIDDDRLPWKSRLHEELKQDCYLFWLAPQQRLVQFWRRPFFHPSSTDEWTELLANPFSQPWMHPSEATEALEASAPTCVLPNTG